jgi:Tfp pilus assembly protein PilF
VASRTSAFSFKDRKASVAEIGEALNVAYILEGSIRKAGETLRITAQLIDTKTDKHVWSETYDRPLTAENIFQIQDEISKAIVLELNGRIDLLPDANKPLTKSTKALEAYLKGKAAYATRDAEDIETGITELIRAVTLDPEFAVAHAKLARAYTLAANYGELASVNANPRAQIHIEKALALAPDDSEVLSEYAWWLFSSKASADEIVAAFDAAIAANPNNAEAYRGKGFVLMNNGSLDQAKIALERAKALNPRDWLTYATLSGLMGNQGEHETQKNLSIEALLINPESNILRADLAGSYVALGDLATAHRILQSCRSEKPCTNELIRIYLQLGMQTDDLRPLNDYEYLIKHYVAGDFDQIAQQLSVNTEFSATSKVEFYAWIGRWDEAYTLIQNNPSVFEPYLSGKPSKSDADVYTQIVMLATLERKRDPRAAAVRASLTNKYKNSVPGKRAILFSYINGAAWAMLNGDPDRAMVWLNAMADRDLYTLLDHDALLEPLKTRADYQAFLARMDGFKARDRALLEAQLANPPKVWWSPSELAEAKTP